MTNDQLIAELKQKQQAGKLKPSQFKNKKPMTKPTWEKVQQELNSLKEKLNGQEPALLIKAREELIMVTNKLKELFPDEHLPASQLLTKLITEKDQLEDKLLAKRNQSLKEFGNYQTKLAELNKHNQLLGDRLRRQKASPYPWLEEKQELIIAALLVLFLLLWSKN